MPITSEPAPSLRPWASATGATPLRTMFNLTCPPKCWVKIGHFYFAGNRTFLLCLDISGATAEAGISQGSLLWSAGHAPCNPYFFTNLSTRQLRKSAA